MKQHGHPRRPLRRSLLAAAAALGLCAPAVSSGCGGGFDSISKVEGLRVLAVVADKSYAAPGDDVTFKMTYYDGYVDPQNPDGATRPIQILWLGGCFDPDGDAYYGCYSSLGPVVQGALTAIQSGQPIPADLPIAAGLGLDTFTLKLPEDIVSARPKPEVGPHYGLAYVFFAVCAGQLGPVQADSDGRAGAFPIGCFDPDTHARLGADRFVPGYTQVYSFEDCPAPPATTPCTHRTNQNPVINGLRFNDQPSMEGSQNAAQVPRCAVNEDTRNQPPSCGKEDPFTTCTAIKIDVDVPKDVAEVDPDGISEDGKPLHEVVWVDYYSDKGDFDSEVRLVSDATTGFIDDHSTKWIAPEQPGLATVWAVVHDARGGTSVVQRFINVQ